MLEVNVCFVDLGRIVYHHYINCSCINVLSSYDTIKVSTLTWNLSIMLSYIYNHYNKNSFYATKYRKYQIEINCIVLLSEKLKTGRIFSYLIYT